MSNDLKASLLAAGLRSSSRPSNNSSASRGARLSQPKRDSDFIVVPFHKLRPGSDFVLIEKMGKKFYYTKRHPRTHRIEHVADRKWVITRDLLHKPGTGPACYSLVTHKDVIPAFHDWCVVRVG